MTKRDEFWDSLYSDDYQRVAAQVETLATLNAAQKRAVGELLRETAYQSCYWPLVKLRQLPDLAVELRLLPTADDGAELPGNTLNEIIDLHAHFLSWVDEFGEALTEPESS